MRIYSTDTVEKVDEEIELAGWVDARRDHGKLIFIDLRDKSGIVQLVFSAEGGSASGGNAQQEKNLWKIAEELRPEWVIRVKGKVSKRPENMVNAEIETGRVEVAVENLEVITKAETPPFELNTDGYEVSEEVRMKYRFIDLRRKRLKENLKKRAEIIDFIRGFFTAREFTEVETPFISKSTPEGARDYLVPSRQHPGTFYALPQSPQQYKQLLMVAGLEKYFQIARCFRDEDTRGDRQPEFTQLDVEMSFVEEDDILDLIEDLLIGLVKKVYPDKKLKLDGKKIPRITYEEAMKKYKTDRPDLRDNVKDDNELAFVFVTDFPMFEKKEDGSWGAAHHPFTMPKVSDAKELKEKFKKDPESIKAFQYDVALNGWEIFGGSIRIHDPELLSAVFEALGHSKKDVEEKFGHMLEAFKYGVPPHGGIASGLDRLVAVLQNEPNIREVIAFPKTGDGRDLMMDSPSEVNEEQLKELGLKVEKKKNNGK